MAEGFRFMPLGLVRLRTFRLGLLSCNINAGVHARGRNGRVTQRCHNSPDGKRGYRVQVMSRIRSARRILKKSVSWVEFCLGEDGWLSLARRSQASGLCAGCYKCWGGWWKSQNRKNVYLSPYVEEPLNSKLMKSFVPELRSRKCFSCFEIPMFHVYMLWTVYVRFTYSHIMAM